MFADTKSFFILLIYSVAVGAALGMLYDILWQTLDIFFSTEKEKKESRVPLPRTEKEVTKALFDTDMHFKAKDVVAVFVDVIFFFVAALSVVITLYHLNCGNIRVFSLFCALGGFIIYRVSIGRPLRFLMSKIFAFMKRAVSSVLQLAIKPVRRVLGKFLDKKREESSKKKVRKYLLLMEQNITKRNTKNEGSKGIGFD